MSKAIARIAVYSTLAASAALTIAAPAAAFTPQIMYERIYYNDAAHSVQVGYEQDTCHYFGVGGGRTQGIETPYFDSNPIAWCDDRNISPY